MTYAEALAQMKALADVGDCDPESAHTEADGILCRLLADLGFGELIEHYDRISKWYA